MDRVLDVLYKILTVRGINNIDKILAVLYAIIMVLWIGFSAAIMQCIGIDKMSGMPMVFAAIGVLALTGVVALIIGLVLLIITCLHD
jgi:hypothetical protein